MKGFSKYDCKISASDFDFNTSLFAYAIGYDWYKGIGGVNEF